MKIAIGADHGGFELKATLSAWLREQGHEIYDVGTSSNEAVDYPVFARKVAQAVAGGQAQRGVMIDGAGIGSCMTANKVRGVRAAMAYDLSSARNGREHNDANVLTLGAGLIGAHLARQIVEVFLATDCTEPRHRKRVAMIEGDGAPAAPAAAPAGVDGLSEADLERIATRLAGMLGGHPAPAAAAAPSAGSVIPGDQAPDSPGPLPQAIAKYIDHTILKPEATRDQVAQICDEAREHLFKSVCVNPTWTRFVTERLRGCGVLTCTVVGFPLGAAAPEVKAAETRRAIRDGAREIDMVINVGALKAGEDDLVLRDIRAVTEACRDGGAICKVIIETALLTDEEKRRACDLSVKARAHFVKTSTGFAKGGATAEDVALMASAVRRHGLEVKASGGVRTYDDAVRMIRAGATRVGASSSVAIVRGAFERT
ncbi:deoxyribose-phosphate aldolase [bacterium]|nr:deoxyribose-phosphate aldolase [bacterium]